MGSTFRKPGVLITMVWIVSVAAIPSLAAKGGEGSDASQYHYRIFRNDKPIGTYDFRITRNGSETEIHAAMEIEVKVLFITAYRAHHERVETWESGELQSLEGESDYNGDIYELAMSRREDEAILRVNGETHKLEGSLHTFSPILKEDWEEGILLTEKGRRYSVSRKPLGKKEHKIGGKSLVLEGYHLSGDVDRVVWYDRNGILTLAAYEKKGNDIRFSRSPGL